MPSHPETRIMALFCDFENVALGVKDSANPKFNIGLVLERLLLKGNIVLKKAYCDWARYRDYKSVMHEAAFEMIEIPHLRMSGKNSADIRLVVDALDLCYTKEHVDTFVIISGDSDFSPLVSKLRENNKTVVGVGVKNSTSDLLIANCDEFIYYDDLIKRRPPQRKPPVKPAAPRTAKAAASADAIKKDDDKKDDDKKDDDKKREAWDLILETYEALIEDRGEEEKIWGSMIKQALKRRKPGFAESYYGFRSFGEMIAEAAEKGIIEAERDEKSGGYIIKGCPAG